MFFLDKPPFYSRADLKPLPSEHSTPGQLRLLFTAGCHCCSAWDYLPSAQTEEQAAHLAREKGWTRKDGLWTCPECKRH